MSGPDSAKHRSLRLELCLDNVERTGRNTRDKATACASRSHCRWEPCARGAASNKSQKRYPKPRMVNSQVLDTSIMIKHRIC
jgi:hypothetical protein